MVRGHSIRYDVGREAIGWSVHPRARDRRIIGQLALVEDSLPTIAIPKYLLLLVVLDKESQRSHVIPVDHQAMVPYVYRPAYLCRVCAMVGTPRPDIVEDHIVMIDFETGRRASQGRAADAEEHIIQRDRVRWIVGFRAVGVLDLEEHRGVDRTGSDNLF